jgi:uncharacterized protein YbcI
MLTSANREQAPPAASPLLEIANVMVHLYKEAFGRGPSKARAQFAGSDTLVVLLEDMMTIAERQLLALGEDALSPRTATIHTARARGQKALRGGANPEAARARLCQRHRPRP